MKLSMELLDETFAMKLSDETFVMRLCNRVRALLDQRNRLVELLLSLLVQFGHIDADYDGRYGAL